MLDWVKEHGTLMWWLTGVSAVVFVGSLLLVPVVVVRIPEDYFAGEKRRESKWKSSHGALRWVILIGRNVLGAILVLAGLAMLVLPGQGVLTVLLGLVVMEFPGKYRLERWLISRKRVLKGINWLRARRGKPPLRVDGSGKK